MLPSHHGDARGRRRGGTDPAELEPQRRGRRGGGGPEREPRGEAAAARSGPAGGSSTFPAPPARGAAFPACPVPTRPPGPGARGRGGQCPRRLRRSAEPESRAAPEAGRAEAPAAVRSRRGPGEPRSPCGVGSGPSALPGSRGAVPAERGPPGAAARGGPGARGAGAAGGEGGGGEWVPPPRGPAAPPTPGVPPAAAPRSLSARPGCAAGADGGSAREGGGSVLLTSE